MLVNLLGYKEVNYTSKRTGKPVSGTELHVFFADSRVNGSAVDKLFVRGSVTVPSLKVGSAYNVLFDRYGSVDFVSAVEK